MFISRAAVIFLTVAACACAGRQGPAAGGESIRSEAASPSLSPGAALPSVQARVAAYWKHREAKDLASAYGFYCNAYKEKVPPAQFLRLTRLTRFDLRDVRVVRIDEAADGAAVTIAYEFLVPSVSVKPLTTETTERWSRDTDGQWCREDEPAGLPFPSSSPHSTSDSPSNPG